jgi:hypothetical protein
MQRVDNVVDGRNIAEMCSFVVLALATLLMEILDFGSDCIL